MTYTRVAEHRAALRLHLNENTAGCSPAVLAAIQSLDRQDASFYPDYSALTRRCEEYFGVSHGWVQLTNGLDEGLYLAALWARLQTSVRSGGLKPAGYDGRDGDAIIIVEPAFEMYSAYAEAVGLSATYVASEADFRFPLTKVLDAIGPATRLINLTDPNNPTGTPIPDGAIEQIAQAAPSAIVLVDEAYADFSGRTSIGGVLSRASNVIVGRTFAKAHGLAGLRIGALIGWPTLIEELLRLQPPYSVNVCAVRALDAALDDRAYVDWYVAQASESRRLVYAFCDRFDLPYWPSEGNFVLVQLGDSATEIVEGLSARGIEIRDRSRRPGCSGCVRITAGVVDATATCLAALEDELASRAG